MISFITIGRNEGWKLSKCIQSIIETISHAKIDSFEIIYVDSGSSDSSVEIAKKFGIVKIFKLTGDMNAAIARNTGAKEAKGEILFFIDGDMEINAESFLDLFDDSGNLKFDFISGDFENYYYEDSNVKEILDKEMYHNNSEIERDSIAGGLFAIDKEKWLLVNGMRNIFKAGEDLDLGLRMSKNGIYLYRLPINLAIHHTVDYRSDRLWKQLWNSTQLYRSLLYRKNLFNLNTLKLLIRHDYSLISLIVSIIAFLLFRIPEIFLFYLAILILRSILKKSIKYLIYFLIRDVIVIFGLFFFHPKINKVSYISIK